MAIYQPHEFPCCGTCTSCVEADAGYHTCTNPEARLFGQLICQRYVDNFCCQEHSALEGES